MYITVNGAVKKSGYVKADPIPLLSFSQVIPLGLQVANDGGIHFQTTASFSVTDLTGKEVFKANFDRLILPSTVRDISTNWSSQLPVGIYKVHRQATAADKTTVLDTQTIVVVSPWFFLGIILVIGSVIAFFIIRSNQRKRKA